MLIRLRKFTLILITIILILSCQPQVVRGNSLKILLPLYVYPNWYDPENYLWSEVISAAAKVPIVAIINPNNGPDNKPPNHDYQKGLADLRTTKISILGYVYTQYGDRSITEVINDINLYARYYDLDGIFLDETASDAETIDYYQKIYHYVKTKTHLKQIIINPGTDLDEGYLAQPVADTAVVAENYAQIWQQYQPQLYHRNYPANRFASLVHSVTDVSTMKNCIDLAIARNFGYVYVTNDSPQSADGNPWNSLPSYWQEEVDYIKSLR